MDSGFVSYETQNCKDQETHTSIHSISLMHVGIVSEQDYQLRQGASHVHLCLWFRPMGRGHSDARLQPIFPLANQYGSDGLLSFTEPLDKFDSELLRVHMAKALMCGLI